MAVTAPGSLYTGDGSMSPNSWGVGQGGRHPDGYQSQQADRAVEKRLKSLEANLKQIRRNARTGDMVAMYQYGALFSFRGEPGPAARWLQRAAEKGHPDACYLVGLWTIQGHGVKKDPEKGVGLLYKAGNAQHTQAIYTLARLMLGASPDVPPDYARGRHLLRFAARDLENPEAQLYIAGMYGLGQSGFARNPFLEFFFLRKANESKHPIATRDMVAASEARSWMRLQAGKKGQFERFKYNFMARQRGEPWIPATGPDPLVATMKGFDPLIPEGPPDEFRDVKPIYVEVPDTDEDGLPLDDDALTDDTDIFDDPDGDKVFADTLTGDDGTASPVDDVSIDQRVSMLTQKMDKLSRELEEAKAAAQEAKAKSASNEARDPAATKAAAAQAAAAAARLKKASEAAAKEAEAAEALAAELNDANEGDGGEVRIKE